MKKTNEAELHVLLLKKEEKIRKMEAMEKVYAADTSQCAGYSTAKSKHKEKTNPLGKRLRSWRVEKLWKKS